MTSLKLHKSKHPCNNICFKNYTTIGTMVSQLKISALKMCLSSSRARILIHKFHKYVKLYGWQFRKTVLLRVYCMNGAKY